MQNNPHDLETVRGGYIDQAASARLGRILAKAFKKQFDRPTDAVKAWSMLPEWRDYRKPPYENYSGMEDRPELAHLKKWTGQDSRNVFAIASQQAARLINTRQAIFSESPGPGIPVEKKQHSINW